MDLTIAPISRYSLTWLTSADFFKLYAQLTECTQLEESKFEEWFNELIHNPLFVLFGVTKRNEDVPHVTLVGTACLYIQPRYYRDGAKSAIVEDIVIDEQYRGRGVGSKLLSTILQYAHERQFYKVTLQCSDDKVHFYEQCGFKQVNANMEVRWK